MIHANSRKLIVLIIVLAMIICNNLTAQPSWQNQTEGITITVFESDHIHFLPDSSDKYGGDNLIVEDNGRHIQRKIIIPEYDLPVIIKAYVAIEPVAKDPRSVSDPWDRAGSIYLDGDGNADIELIKFITAYGGFTEFEADISHLAPLIKDECTFGAFIDTWLSPAWQVDFYLHFEPASDSINPAWSGALVNEQSYTSEKELAGGIISEIEIPQGLERVRLYYLASGHCTDGREDDEFITKDHVIYVDDIPAHRYRPWRDDCREFRAVNPYCAKWSDGWWSSDFSRSGWCPGDDVEPVILDLSDHLTAGTHIIRFMIEGIRPKNEDGHYGYWRISSYLVGWKNK